jgi:hypothetical protein
LKDLRVEGILRILSEDILPLVGPYVCEVMKPSHFLGKELGDLLMIREFTVIQ